METKLLEKVSKTILHESIYHLKFIGKEGRNLPESSAEVLKLSNVDESQEKKLCRRKLEIKSNFLAIICNFRGFLERGGAQFTWIHIQINPFYVTRKNILNFSNAGE